MLFITQLTRTINTNSLFFPQWTTNLLIFSPIFFSFPSAKMEKRQNAIPSTCVLNFIPSYPRPLLLDYQLHSFTIHLPQSVFWIVSISLQTWPTSFSLKQNKQNSIPWNQILLQSSTIFSIFYSQTYQKNIYRHQTLSNYPNYNSIFKPNRFLK